jgi:hypothetical protein
MKHIRKFNESEEFQSYLEEVSPQEIEKRANEIPKPFMRSLDNDFYHLLNNLKEHGKNPDKFNYHDEDTAQIYKYHYKGYSYENMIELVKKLVEMGKVSDDFITDYSEEFPELE